MDIKQIYNLFKKHPVVCTDTRTIVPDCLFFCLKGENFNGNKFAGEALKKGASFVVIDDPDYIVDQRCLLVDDVLQTLQALALFHRKMFQIPVLGITGTNGKTTTKELINAVLTAKYNTLSTQGNLNNHIGVPLTILSMDEKTEIAVIEMGANHAGEIAQLCEIALPTLGLITNVGKAHLEGFNNIETIIETKTALYDFVKRADGTIFVNSEDDLLLKQSEGIKRVTYGKTEKADYQGQMLSTALFAEIFLPKENISLKTNLIGEYNFYNIMSAFAVGRFFDISANEISQLIASYFPVNNRSQMVEKEGNIFILDAYNANPSSMELSLYSFSKLPNKNKVLILGDMKELGAESEKEHQAIVDLIKKLEFEEVYLLGEEFSKTNCSDIWKHSDMENLKKILFLKANSQSMILIKGSRGMKMEQLLDF